MFRGLYADRIEKKARRGNLGYPVGTIAFYGPDDTRASKLVFSVVGSEKPGADLLAHQKWFSETEDLRYSGKLARQVLELIEEHGCRSVVMVDAIIGCPHEEGIDYPEEEACPQCPFWIGRDRFAGTPLEEPARIEKAELLARMAQDLATRSRR
jgi:hypothetical protein